MSFSPKHILVPVSLDPQDDTALAEKSVRTASDMALKFQAEITLLYLAEKTYGESLKLNSDNEVFKILSNLLKERLALAHETLMRLKEVAEHKGVKTRILVLESEQNIAMAICDKATEQKADLIVIGTHARKGIKRFLLGSVAQRVAQLSPVDVLLVR